jgi:hypothetical protein
VLISTHTHWTTETFCAESGTAMSGGMQTGAVVACSLLMTPAEWPYLMLYHLNSRDGNELTCSLAVLPWGPAAATTATATAADKDGGHSAGWSLSHLR